MTLISDEYKILYSLQTTTAKEHIRQIARMRSKRRKMRCNYNPKTRLQNNDRYAKAVVYKYKDISSLNYTQFIQTLKREVGFKDKRSGIYYYIKIADIATKLYRAIFIIELLI
ncbi:hypothetical protein HBI21_242400 [Parastagonospora nodorum]|nr:hypothetical protein HBI21_242400 [Parastagonospora nodorum]